MIKKTLIVLLSLVVLACTSCGNQEEARKKLAEMRISYNDPLALFGCVQESNYEIVQLLIDAGADVNVRHANTTPLLIAAKLRVKNDAQARTNYDITKALIDAKADLNAKDGSGCTPLMLAAQYGKTGVVQLLLDNGADVNVVDGYNQTALMYAVSAGHINVVKAILNEKPDLNIRNTNGFTALDVAKNKRHTEIVNLLSKR